MTKVGRTVEKGETQGFMKIIVGAHAHEMLAAATLGTGSDVHIHPTVSELIPTMPGELQPLSDGAGVTQRRTEK
jgi:hypothetical protein